MCQFTDEMIKEEDLQLILQAGEYAASGQGKQAGLMIVVQDPAMLEELTKAAGNVFASNWDKETLHVDLDPEKAETLQKWVWEAALEHDLTLK